MTLKPNRPTSAQAGETLHKYRLMSGAFLPVRLQRLTSGERNAMTARLALVTEFVQDTFSAPAASSGGRLS